MFWFKQIYGVIPGFFLTVLKHPLVYTRANKEAARRTKELAMERELPYEIPLYRPDMISHKYRQKYLRPTILCESRAPEIIALANELGAWRKPDREYAEACFDFVKKNVQFTFFQPVLGAVKTLKLGEGICLDKAGLFIALCRAGGIPARYKIYNEAFITPVYRMITTGNPVTKEWYDSLGYFVMHGAAEAFIDGEWLASECVQTPEIEAGLGVPLLQLGEDASGSYSYRIPGSTARLERLPPGLIILVSMSVKLERGFFLPIELQLRETAGKGREILEAGGEEEYDRRARETHRATLPEVSKRLFMALQKADEEEDRGSLM